MTRGGGPLVSVLLPVRDGGVHLAEAIASVQAQTLSDFEVIAVDDGSTDDTGRILDEWVTGDARVRKVVTPPRGIVAALETARGVARGRYLARMDADDVAHPERLEAQVGLMTTMPGLAVCGTLIEYFPRRGLRDGARRYERWINEAVTPRQIARAVFVECPLPHPTLLLRSDVLEQVGGYRDLGWPEDYDLVLRLWAAGHELGKVDRRLLRWRERPDRLSRRDTRYAAGAFRACKVHHLRRTLLSDGRNAVVWGAGPVGKALSRALRDSGSRVAAFVELDPRKIGQEIHGAPVLDPDTALREWVGRDPAPLHLAAVGQVGARARIEALLEGVGARPLRDFVAVA